jgi:hypothetical protein
MTRTTYAIGAALCVGLSLWAPSARAQAPEKDEDAERLFREAQKHMAERRFGEACFKFEQVYRKDRQLGTLLNLAYCHKMQGATWQAWLEFKEAELKAIEIKRNDRRDFARQRMAELEKGLVRAVVDVPPSVQLFEVLIEDRRVPEAEKGMAFVAEPGPRKVTYRAKGKKQVVELVTFGPTTGKGARVQHLAVPKMEEQDKEIVEAIATATPQPTPEPPRPAAAPPAAGAEPSNRGGTQRTIALILGGVGIAGLAAGSVTGVMTLSNDCSSSGKSDNRCPTDPVARQNEKDSGQTTGTISDISFAVGGAALAAGVILYLTAPRGSVSTTSAIAPTKKLVPGLGLGWASLSGEF